MKVLVTGATGGLGQLIVEALLQGGHEVIASSRDGEKAKQLPFYSKVKYISYVISEKEEGNLFQYFQEPDCLVHLAWENLNDYRNSSHLTTQLPKQKTFLSNLITHGLKDLTVVGTCYEYGLTEGQLVESMPSAPIFDYSQAKTELYEFLKRMQTQQRFSLKWPRVFYVFGEVKERKNLYTLLEAAIRNNESTFNMSGGEQVRDFLSPKQVADYIVQVAVQTEVADIINICSGVPIKLRDLVEDYIKSQNSSLKINYGFYPYPNYEPMHSWGSAEKLKMVTKAKNKFDN